MLKDTFYLDGIGSDAFGIKLQREMIISEPVPVVTAQSVPGRNGDIIYETGTYKNRTAIAECFCLQNDVVNNVEKVNKFLFSKNGYRRLELSSDPEHFLLARVKNGAAINQRLGKLNAFKIEFDCKPQRFLKSGETSVRFKTSGKSIFNYTGYVAKPMIRVKGSGSGMVSIGGIVVTINEIVDEMILDCETMNAYSNSLENLNKNINAPEFPVLNVGENIISFDGGVTAVAITPRWWIL
jgi:phage-related protein